jgi:hypothetical protein
VKVMLEILGAKFTQNPEARLLLLGTGNQYLVEASPTDTFWGAGMHAGDPRLQRGPEHPRFGTNMMGVLLMKVRRHLDTSGKTRRQYREELELFEGTDSPRSPSPEPGPSNGRGHQLTAHRVKKGGSPLRFPSLPYIGGGRPLSPLDMRGERSPTLHQNGHRYEIDLSVLLPEERTPEPTTAQRSPTTPPGAYSPTSLPCSPDLPKVSPRQLRKVELGLQKVPPSPNGL